MLLMCIGLVLCGFVLGGGVGLNLGRKTGILYVDRLFNMMLKVKRAEGIELAWVSVQDTVLCIRAFDGNDTGLADLTSKLKTERVEKYEGNFN